MSASGLKAQTQPAVQNDPSSTPPWYVGLAVGYDRFEGDEAVKNTGFIQLKLGYDYSQRWSFEGDFLIFPYLKRNDVYDYETGVPVPREGLDGNSCFALGLDADALFHLFVTEDRHWDPYLIGGFGVNYFSKARASRWRVDPLFRAGAGMAYHFNEEWAVRLDIVEAMTWDSQEFNFMPTVGVDWKWGTRVPAKYAVAGGALDTDGDGLSDAEEIKIGTDPKNPDTDADGLTDGEEVKTYRTDPLNPDTDYDALKDGAEVYNYKTNPLERDTDKGGVADGHEVIEDSTNPLDPSDDLLLFTLHIEFETDKAVIPPEYFKDLDKIGKVMSRDAKSTARIEGHADKRVTSKHDYNMTLSERRAQAVRNYLNEKFGIALSRTTPVGYGYTRPMVPNDPINGNAKNRRVEVYIRKGDQPAGDKKDQPTLVAPAATDALPAATPPAAK